MEIRHSVKVGFLKFSFQLFVFFRKFLVVVVCRQNYCCKFIYLFWSDIFDLSFKLGNGNLHLSVFDFKLSCSFTVIVLLLMEFLIKTNH